MKLTSKAHDVRERSDAVQFVRELCKEFKADPDAFENQTLPDYLEALASWLEDMHGYYENAGEVFDEASPSWKNLCDALGAAAVYE